MFSARKTGTYFAPNGLAEVKEASLELSGWEGGSKGIHGGLLKIADDDAGVERAVVVDEGAQTSVGGLTLVRQQSKQQRTRSPVYFTVHRVHLCEKRRNDLK